MVVFWFYLHFRQLKCGDHTVKQICNNDEDDAYLFMCCFVFLVRYYITTIKCCVLTKKGSHHRWALCVALACSPCSDTLLDWKEDMLE